MVVAVEAVLALDLTAVAGNCVVVGLEIGEGAVLAVADEAVGVGVEGVVDAAVVGHAGVLAFDDASS